MNKMIFTSRLATMLAGTVIAVSLLNTGCGNKESAAQGGGYVAGTEATRKGSGSVNTAPAMSKGKPAPSTQAGAKTEEKSTVAPPSNSVQTQGGGNLAL